MFGRIVPVCLGLALLFGSGCSRAYDGTVIIPRPLDVRRFWDRPPPNVEYEAAQPEAGAFPVAPQPPKLFSERRVDSGKVRRHSTTLAPKSSNAGPEKQLQCRNASEPGKRVRMVCE
ncbi:hypothetical protein [Mesorhizobium sp.]|jgi:hypothetical protein|uniref:hypothetical protein n=1 Tax=Mesorhizobium sp. TaxID=1871066 RepID=UPI003563B356